MREWSWVGSVGWKLHSAIPPPAAGGPLVRKPASDAFCRTPVQAELDKLGVGRLVVAGLQTEYCVDTTCRAAVSGGRAVLLAADAHTVEAGGELPAERIVAHHNAVLDGFGNDERVVRVRPAGMIRFTD